MATVEPLTFVGSLGSELCGILHRPEGPAKGAVLMAHCFTCSKDIHTTTRLAKGLAEAGFAALRFDFTGLGESEGDFATSTVTSNISDLTRAATSLIQKGFGPCGLVGHSLGGAAVLLAAQRLKTVRSVVTIAAPSDTLHVQHLIGDDGVVRLGGMDFALDPSFASDLETHDVLTKAAQLQRPYLVVHAEDDDIVGIEHGERLHAAAAEPKQFARLEAGGHMFGKRKDADNMINHVVNWFTSTL